MRLRYFSGIFTFFVPVVAIVIDWALLSSFFSSSCHLLYMASRNPICHSVRFTMIHIFTGFKHLCSIYVFSTLFYSTLNNFAISIMWYFNNVALSTILTFNVQKNYFQKLDTIPSFRHFGTFNFVDEVGV